MPTIFGRTREKYFPSIVSQDQVRPNGSSPELIIRRVAQVTRSTVHKGNSNYLTPELTPWLLTKSCAIT